jgi:hypothetical protein
MIDALVDQFGLKNDKPVGTPIAEVVHATEDTNLLTASETSSFRTLAGALLYQHFMYQTGHRVRGAPYDA